MNKLLILSFVTLTSLSSAFAGGGSVGSDKTEASCSIQVAKAQALVEKDGYTNDEKAFLAEASAAMTICSATAKNWASVRQTLKIAKQSCDESANQGLSDLNRGTCYLKAAELATFILGR